MRDTNEARTITVWRYLDWRCEYWDCGDASELRLYLAERLVQLARPVDTFETLARSARWHSEVPVPDLRSGRDRRAIRRGGRRAEDHPA
jgi:hypothetical protein